MDFDKRKWNATFWVAIAGYAISILMKAGVPVPGYTNELIVSGINLLVLAGVLADTSKPGFGFSWEGVKQSCMNSTLWIAALAYVVLIGSKTGMYVVPANVQDAFTTFSDMLVFLGILYNPTTKSLND